MTILALDCSTNIRSAAILRDDQILCALNIDAPPRGFSAVALTQRALGEAGIQPRDLSKIVVGLGPGSYTGIRSSIAVAQAFSLATGLATQGLSSMDALAHTARRAGLTGEFTFAIDAQRSEFYVASYRIEPGAVIPLEPLHLAPRETLAAIPDDQLAGPDLAQIFPGAHAVTPEALSLALLAQRAPADQPAETLEPIYLRATTFLKAPPPKWL